MTVYGESWNIVIIVVIDRYHFNVYLDFMRIIQPVHKRMCMHGLDNSHEHHSYTPHAQYNSNSVWVWR